MRTIVTLAALLLLTIGARAGHTLRVQSLIKESYKLNSGSHIGGRSRVVLPVTLPPKTVAVFYTVQTTQTNMPDFIDLAGQLATMVRANPVRTAGNFITYSSRITGTKADGITDVAVITDYEQSALFLAKKQYTDWGQYSRNNLGAGTVTIPLQKVFADQYLWFGLRNPSAYKAVTVSIEVAIIIED